MTKRVDLYETHYSQLQASRYQDIRRETYGEDLGQTSWITLEEGHRLLNWLNLSPSSMVLEVACGSGGVSVLMAKETGANVLGIDVNEEAIKAARERAQREHVEGKARFELADASRRLMSDDGTFSAVFCNDSINHLPGREHVFKEWFRVLQPGGKALFTDPTVVSGILTDDEIASRSSIGFYLYAPFGENERLLQSAGFEVLRTENVTDQVAVISKRWYEARERREALLKQFETEERYLGLQKFLRAVHTLSSEGRLSRYVFLAAKPAE